MKAHIESRIFFNQFKFKPLCENGVEGSGGRLLPFYSWVSSLFLLTLRQFVTRGCLVGNLVVTTVKESASNDRIFVGLVMLAVSPILWNAHLFFDYNTIIPGWYYKNWFFWFFTNREELTFGIGLTGFFLLCQQKWGYRYLLTPIVTLCACEVIYQSFQIDNWTDFYNPMWSTERGWELGLFILFLVFALWKAINYTVYRKYHLKDGNVARLIGIIKAPGISVEKKMNILEQLVNESENYNSRI